jgi:hypothetical protein
MGPTRYIQVAVGHGAPQALTYADLARLRGAWGFFYCPSRSTFPMSQAWFFLEHARGASHDHRSQWHGTRKGRGRRSSGGDDGYEEESHRYNLHILLFNRGKALNSSSTLSSPCHELGQARAVQSQAAQEHATVISINSYPESSALAAVLSLVRDANPHKVTPQRWKPEPAQKGTGYWVLEHRRKTPWTQFRFPNVWLVWLSAVKGVFLQLSVVHEVNTSPWWRSVQGWLTMTANTSTRGKGVSRMSRPSPQHAEEEGGKGV